MKYPKNSKTVFLQLSDNDCRQINMHIGRKWTYWFIEPSEHPIKLLNGEYPSILKDNSYIDINKLIIKL